MAALLVALLVAGVEGGLDGSGKRIEGKGREEKKKEEGGKGIL
jgi:hypothetical protein